MAVLVDGGPNPTYPMGSAPGNTCIHSPTGRYYVSYVYLSGGNNGLAVRYSDNKGATWSSPEIVEFVAGYNVISHAIAVDSSGNLYVVWAGGGRGTYPAQPNVRCRVRYVASGTWSAITDVTDSNVTHGNLGVDIDIDSSGKIHIVFNVDGSAYGATTGLSQVFYTNNISYTWPHVSGINNPFLLSNNIHADQWASILISAIDGTIHVVWHGRTSASFPNWYYKCYYRQYPVGGPWSPEEYVYNNPGSGADGDGAVWPSIVEDVDKTIYCSFVFKHPDYEVYENNRPFGGVFGAPTVVQAVPSAGKHQVGVCRETIDQSRNRYCYWYGLGWGANPNYYNIQKKKYDFATSSWGPRTPITDKGWNCVHNHTQYCKISLAISGSSVVWSEVTGNNPVYFEGNEKWTLSKPSSPNTHKILELMI